MKRPTRAEQPWLHLGTKKTPQAVEGVCDALAHGVPRQYAVVGGGVSYVSLLNWEQAGRDSEADGDLESWDYEVYALLKEAEARFFHDTTRAVLEHAPKDWKAGMTLMERRDPDQYGRRERRDVRLSGSVASVQITADDMTEAARMAREFEDMMFGDDEDGDD